MKKMITTIAVLSLVLMLCGTVFAASSKVTADCADITLIQATEQTHSWDTILSNTLKTAQPSDLNVDVSLECGLLTRTLVRSKGGDKDTSLAEAGVQIRVLLDGNDVTPALPGAVTFCRRTQELSAVFQGLLTDAEGNVCLYIDPDTGAIKIDEECLRPEEVELLLDTMSANSFNFILPDVGVGMHTLEVQAEISSNTSALEGEAEALGLIGKGTVAVEEVKYIKRQEY